jgi:hypothetical protein
VKTPASRVLVFLGIQEPTPWGQKRHVLIIVVLKNREAASSVPDGLSVE